MRDAWRQSDGTSFYIFTAQRAALDLIENCHHSTERPRNKDRRCERAQCTLDCKLSGFLNDMIFLAKLAVPAAGCASIRIEASVLI